MLDTYSSGKTNGKLPLTRSRADQIPDKVFSPLVPRTLCISFDSIMVKGFAYKLFQKQYCWMYKNLSEEMIKRKAASSDIRLGIRRVETRVSDYS